MQLMLSSGSSIATVQRGSAAAVVRFTPLAAHALKTRCQRRCFWSRRWSLRPDYEYIRQNSFCSPSREPAGLRWAYFRCGHRESGERRSRDRERRDHVARRQAWYENSNGSEYERRIQHIRRLVEADPFTALFGRRAATWPNHSSTGVHAWRAWWKSLEGEAGEKNDTKTNDGQEKTTSSKNGFQTTSTQPQSTEAEKIRSVKSEPQTTSDQSLPVTAEDGDIDYITLRRVKKAASEYAGHETSADSLKSEKKPTTDKTIPELVKDVREEAKESSNLTTIVKNHGSELGKLSQAATESAQREQGKHPVRKVRSGSPETEDLDLLRTSDVRAAAGVQTKETDADKQQRRRRLDQDFNKVEPLPDSTMQDFMLSARAQRRNGSDPEKATKSSIDAEQRENEVQAEEAAKAIEEERMLQIEAEIEEEMELEKQKKFEAERAFDPHRVDNQVTATEDSPSLDNRVLSTASKPTVDRITTSGNVASMPSPASVPPFKGEGDVTADVAKFARRRPSIGVASEPTLSTSRPDNSLAKEIQKIYEDSAVDTPTSNHVQREYVILAYDPHARSISSARMTSTHAAMERIFTPAEVVHKLRHPARFLPHFSDLQAGGYEVVSGQGDVLVFKRVRPNKATEGESATAEANVESSSVNPIDGTTGRFASPTGFVNHDAVFPEAGEEGMSVPSTGANAAESSTPMSSTTAAKPVRRVEEVFSGAGPHKSTTTTSSSSSTSSSTQFKSRPGRLRRTARRIFLVGVWCAACSYAVGVVLEFFRTGGSGGIQGF